MPSANARSKFGIEKKTVVDELHRPARKHFHRRKVFQVGINDTFQIDLVEMIPYAAENNDYKYLLTAIDIFSKKAFARALKTKTGAEVAKAMDSIITENGSPPRNVHSDQGKEFFNKDFKNLMKKYNINLYNTFSELKASIVERFNRTLKTKMWKMFSLNGNYQWINHLQSLIDDYNNSVHRTIKMKPIEVTKQHEPLLFKTVYKNRIITSKNRFKAGDYVRITKYKGIFRKGYEPNWSTEIFQVDHVHPTEPVTYTLRDNTSIMSGGFYEHELQKVKYKDVYLVEKVVKKKGNQLLVKWLGFDEKFNSWINKKDFI